MPKMSEKARKKKFQELFDKCEKYKTLRHKSLDQIPVLIKRFMDKEIDPSTYMSEYQKIKDTVQRCQDNEMKWGAHALAYSGF